jgi:SIR2-like protein
MPDQLLPIPPVPEGLREAAQRGILIPFIGAGVSRLAGCPSWAEFADAALRWLIFDGKFTYSQLDQIRHLHPRVKLSLARTLAAERNTVINFRALLHPKARREHEKGCRLYRSLFALGKTFVTTNYDEWLDERLPEPTPAAIPAVQPAPADTPPVKPIQVVHKVDELLPALLSEPNTVIHLHGSLRDPAGMILTTRDYMRHYANDRLLADPQRENRVLTFLDFLFKEKTVLFIGYGLDELEILEYVILKAGRPVGTTGRESRHYILQGFFSHEEALLRSLKSYYLSECDIQLIPFLRDDKDWDQLLDVLEEFARRIPASDPLILQKAQEMEDLLNG